MYMIQAFTSERAIGCAATEQTRVSVPVVGENRSVALDHFLIFAGLPRNNFPPHRPRKNRGDNEEGSLKKIKRFLHKRDWRHKFPRLGSPRKRNFAGARAPTPC